MEKKFLLIALANNFGSSVGELVADDAGFYFLNIDDYIEYSLLDGDKMLVKCGKDYYLKQELKSIVDCLGFEKTLYYCSYDVFINNQNLFEDCQKIYIALSKKQLGKINDKDFVINNIAFEDRDLALRKICKVVESEFAVLKIFANNIINIVKVKK
ncbi:MAG: hypothetical protein PHQ62_03595 [Clostridia bacterium]|nr:hypothetical protein [Clostridia bacterium]